MKTANREDTIELILSYMIMSRLISSTTDYLKELNRCNNKMLGYEMINAKVKFQRYLEIDAIRRRN